MTAQVFNIRDYQSKKPAKPETLEQMAVEIFNVALADYTDTAPSEYCAPPQDSA